MRNHWSCLPTAFAQSLNISFDEMIRRIGHDGSRVVWDLPEPNCRRGFHIQECIDVARQFGMSVMEIELYPRHAPSLDVEPITVEFDDNQFRFNSFIATTRGVLTGVRNNGNGHAVAYDHGIYDDTNFTPARAWSINEIQPRTCQRHAPVLQDTYRQAGE